jgi:polysaccharide pyruvyl transferase WcaK-like protein
MRKIFYFNIPSPAGNAGDDVLSMAIIKKFESFGQDIHWTSYPVRNYTTPAVIDRANESDIVLIGGHGLLISDTNKNDISGWQWRCPMETLKKLKKPLIFYSVGYNMMEGQEPFHHNFESHIRLTAEKSAFFSVRNNRSKQMLIRYRVPEEKIIINHCPSIFLVPEKKIDFPRSKPRVGISLAGDRMNLRIKNTAFFFAEMRKLLKGLQKDYQICFINHNWNPVSNCQNFIDSVLDELDKPIVYNIETVWSCDNDVEYILNLYKSMDVVIGMRGHSQLVAFGQSAPFISLISHNKLRWFLEDVDMLETGFEVFDNYFAEDVIRLATNFIDHPVSWRGKHESAYCKIKSNFDKNNQLIRERFF